MKGGFGIVIFFVIPAVDTFFFNQFEGWAEVVVPETPEGGVEGIDRFDQTGIIETVVSEKVSDTTPVFLFDMGVVIFSIGARPGE